MTYCPVWGRVQAWFNKARTQSVGQRYPWDLQVLRPLACHHQKHGDHACRYCWTLDHLTVWRLQLPCAERCSLHGQLQHRWLGLKRKSENAARLPGRSLHILHASMLKTEQCILSIPTAPPLQLSSKHFDEEAEVHYSSLHPIFDHKSRIWCVKVETGTKRSCSQSYHAGHMTGENQVLIDHRVDAKKANTTMGIDIKYRQQAVQVARACHRKQFLMVNLTCRVEDRHSVSCILSICLPKGDKIQCSHLQVLNRQLLMDYMP